LRQSGDQLCNASKEHNRPFSSMVPLFQHKAGFIASPLAAILRD
jgi:hypothetical protein